jgi:hypothetical protein
MKLLVVVALPILLAGCATPDSTGEMHEQKVYRTGSNIPTKDTDAQSRAKSMDGQSYQLPPVPITTMPRAGGG